MPPKKLPLKKTKKSTGIGLINPMQFEIVQQYDNKDIDDVQEGGVRGIREIRGVQNSKEQGLVEEVLRGDQESDIIVKSVKDNNVTKQLGEEKNLVNQQFMKGNEKDMGNDKDIGNENIGKEKDKNKDNEIIRHQQNNKSTVLLFESVQQDQTHLLVDTALHEQHQFFQLVQPKQSPKNQLKEGFKANKKKNKINKQNNNNIEQMTYQNNQIRGFDTFMVVQEHRNENSNSMFAQEDRTIKENQVIRHRNDEQTQGQEILEERQVSQSTQLGDKPTRTSEKLGTKHSSQKRDQISHIGAQCKPNNLSPQNYSKSFKNIQQQYLLSFTAMKRYQRLAIFREDIASQLREIDEYRSVHNGFQSICQPIEVVSLVTEYVRLGQEVAKRRGCSVGQVLKINGLVGGRFRIHPRVE